MFLIHVVCEFIEGLVIASRGSCSSLFRLVRVLDVLVPEFEAGEETSNFLQR